jgi:putative copper resistance protein D
MFSVHMGQHMMLNMLVPILLVLGGPVTLLLRALPPAGAGAPPGPREWVLAAVHSPVARVLTHPLVALALFVGSFYVLYFSGLFDVALESHWAHIAMNIHFLLVGLIFFWPIVGIDPSPRQLPPIGRLGLLFIAIPLHAFFGIAVMTSATVIGSGFYQQLEMPWIDRLADQTAGGGLAWATGEVPMLIVLIALLVQWSRADERTARREDRRADRDGDRDLEAYNAMLRSLATTGRAAPPESGSTDESSAESTADVGERRT